MIGIKARRMISLSLTLIMLLIMSGSVFAIESFDREKFSDTNKYRIRVFDSALPTGTKLGDDEFELFCARYEIDNMKNQQWVSSAWKQNILFSFKKVPSYLRDFGPGRIFTIINKKYGTDNTLGVDEEETVDLQEGRYFTRVQKEWWAANGRHATTWFYNYTDILMFYSLKIKEKEPVDKTLEELKKSSAERQLGENEQRSLEEINMKGRKVFLEKSYTLYDSDRYVDYMVDSHIRTNEASTSSWIYTTIIEPEEFPEIYFVVTAKVTTNFRYDKTDASGEIYQYAEELYQDYQKQLEVTLDEIVPELINNEPEITYLEPVIGKTIEEKASDKPGSVTINTKADKDTGETDVSIPTALAIVIIGTGAAIAGAGASGDNGGDNGKKKSRYKMYLKKDFGDAIRYDTQPVTVYSRIGEITSEGEEIDRPDLTASLEIFSGENLMVEGTSMVGNYMGALVSAESVKEGKNPDSGILSIRFSGEGGSFQNNVTFRLIGKPYISLAGPNLSILVGSGKKFKMLVEFVDFTEPPKNIVFNSDTLPITLEQDREGNHYIEVADDTPKPETIIRFYEEIPCTISADSGDETVMARFTVLKCYEGLLADFLGKENEIMAYKNKDGEMPVTNIGFQAGLWNTDQSQLDLIAPKQMSMSYEDKEGIYEIIGLSYEHNIDLSTSQNTVYSFTAKKSLPSPDKIEGKLRYSCEIGDIRMENETTIYLIPDLLTYAKDFEQEFKNCENIIFTYMSGELMKRKAEELYRDKNKLGLEDLKLFRKHCWEIASRMILQKKEDYMQDVYWHDEAIAWLDLTVFVGDVAFALALTPYGGPITSFLVDNVKSTFLELCEEYVKKGDIFTWDTLQEIIWNRFKQSIGSVDNFISIPENATPKQMVAWICSFYLYRVFYHWNFDEDESGNSLGLVAALENSLKDLLTNRSMALLGDYVKEVAKKEGIDFSKRIKAEEDVVDTALVGAFDMSDKGATLLDDVVEKLVDYIKRRSI